MCVFVCKIQIQYCHASVFFCMWTWVYTRVRKGGCGPGSWCSQLFEAELSHIIHSIGHRQELSLLDTLGAMIQWRGHLSLLWGRKSNRLKRRIKGGRCRWKVRKMYIYIFKNHPHWIITALHNSYTQPHGDELGKNEDWSNSCRSDQNWLTCQSFGLKCSLQCNGWLASTKTFPSDSCFP